MAKLTKAELEYRRRMRDDFTAFAPESLKIQTKQATLEPFALNLAQRKLHKRLEEQRKEIGKVRAIILKGRQCGASTYIQGRFYWHTSHKTDLSAFILTHEGEATKQLFSMTKRFHDLNESILRPSTAASNEKALIFDRLRSKYSVGTAGNKETGRSKTVQLFHGSEVAFWLNPLEIMAGVGQAIPDVDGTEVILESTANGIGGMFHDMWQCAERGEGEFIPIFLSWTWQPEYSARITKDFSCTHDETELKRLHGLTDEQILWRRNKIASFGGGEEALKKFKQEYPLTPDEAFQSTGGATVVNSDHVLEARNRNLDTGDYFGARVLGVDPADSEEGKGDVTGFAIRQGRKLHKTWTEAIDDQTVLGRRIVQIMKEELIDFCFIETDGVGKGAHDKVRELGFGERLMGVKVGGGADEKDYYANKRAEIWWKMEEWFREEMPDIPWQDTGLHAEIVAPLGKKDGMGRKLVEKKEDMRKRGIKSPNKADALAVTFTAYVEPTLNNNPIDEWIEEDGYSEVTGY